MKFRYQPSVLGLAMGLGLLTSLGLQPVQGTEAPGAQVKAETPIQDPDPPASANRGAPTRQVDAGTRRSCGTFDPTETGFLTALIPGYGPALTLASHPTFWAYVPFDADDVDAMELSVRPVNEADIATVNIPVPEALPGVVSLPMPETGAALEPDVTYQWVLRVYCRNAPQPIPDFHVIGAVHRVEANTALQQTLAQANSTAERVAVYQQGGLWYEPLTTLGQRYQMEPDNSAIAAEWATFLENLEIDWQTFNIEFDLTTQPIVVE